MDLWRERELLEMERKRLEKDILNFLKTMLDIERRIQRIKESGSIPEIEREIKRIRDKIRRLERRIETQVLGIKEEERISKEVIELIRKKNVLERRLNMLKEKKILEKSLNLLKRKVIEKMTRHNKIVRRLEKIKEEIKEKEKLRKGITVYKEEVDVEEVRRRYEEILRKVKNSKKISLEDLKKLEAYEKLLNKEC